LGWSGKVININKLEAGYRKKHLIANLTSGFRILI